ncbi:Leucine Rich repeats (2 copies) [Pirellula sp. SH-Sr6A]|uniref:hypothetical protein n=1 Tax=Pirellula sp. SH-Sr6A TaxID=1632865 RepID=UPI00078C273C|nr:hypothetical protein [Pirellula sp. SH-Sr6A]AMV32555.1 Leucine Rich repeats (2 copies) [Pirellula sp. SH-Sr6A]
MKFRIRTMMVVVGALSIGFMVVESTTRVYRERCRIEADLHSMGAYYVGFDESNTPSWVSFVAPMSLERIGGFGSFESLDFSGAKITDESLSGVASLKHIRILHLTHCKVTDTQLQILAGIGSIAVLRLNGSPITDEAIPAIASIQGLMSLDVSDTLITSAGLEELKKQRPDIVVCSLW